MTFIENSLQVDLITESWDELMILGFAFSTATNPNLQRLKKIKADLKHLL